MSRSFNRAVGQLRDEKLEVRLGAIFTLEQICLDFSDLSGPVLQLLTIYLRESAVNYGEAEPPRMFARSSGWCATGEDVEDDAGSSQRGAP
ncbi:hypothetical protein Ms3S1_08940 [Methylosinus sp. 3S-1]